MPPSCPHTDGNVAGLLAGSIIFAVGALVAVFTINARVGAPETRETIAPDH
jgi:hypothetical protein